MCSVEFAVRSVARPYSVKSYVICVVGRERRRVLRSSPFSKKEKERVQSCGAVREKQVADNGCACSQGSDIVTCTPLYKRDQVRHGCAWPSQTGEWREAACGVGSWLESLPCGCCRVVPPVPLPQQGQPFRSCLTVLLTFRSLGTAQAVGLLSALRSAACRRVVRARRTLSPAAGKCFPC